MFFSIGMILKRVPMMEPNDHRDGDHRPVLWGLDGPRVSASSRYCRPSSDRGCGNARSCRVSFPAVLNLSTLDGTDELSAHPGAVVALAVNAIGDRLASACDGGEVRIWDTGNPFRR